MYATVGGLGHVQRQDDNTERVNVKKSIKPSKEVRKEENL